MLFKFFSIIAPPQSSDRSLSVVGAGRDRCLRENQIRAQGPVQGDMGEPEGSE